MPVSTSWRILETPDRLMDHPFQSVFVELWSFKYSYIFATFQKTGLSKGSRFVLEQTLIKKISWCYILLQVAILMYAPSYKRHEVQWPSRLFRILATFNLIFTLHSAYFYLIINFGNLKGVGYIAWQVCSVSYTTMDVDTSSCEQELQGDSCHILFKFILWYLVND